MLLLASNVHLLKISVTKLYFMLEILFIYSNFFWSDSQLPSKFEEVCFTLHVPPPRARCKGDLGNKYSRQGKFRISLTVNNFIMMHLTLPGCTPSILVCLTNTNTKREKRERDDWSIMLFHLIDITIWRVVGGWDGRDHQTKTESSLFRWLEISSSNPTVNNYFINFLLRWIMIVG